MIYDFSTSRKERPGNSPLRMLVMGAVPHRPVHNSPMANLHARGGQTRHLQVWISAA